MAVKPYKFTPHEQAAGFVMFLRSVVLDPVAIGLLFNWFVVPLGAQPLTIPGAFGLRAAIGVLAIQRWRPQEPWLHRLAWRYDAGAEPFAGALGIVGLELFMLGVAFFIHLFNR